MKRSYKKSLLDRHRTGLAAGWTNGWKWMGSGNAFVKRGTTVNGIAWTRHGTALGKVVAKRWIWSAFVESYILMWLMFCFFFFLNSTRVTERPSGVLFEVKWVGDSGMFWQFYRWLFSLISVHVECFRCFSVAESCCFLLHNILSTYQFIYSWTHNRIFLYELVVAGNNSSIKLVVLTFIS